MAIRVGTHPILKFYAGPVPPSWTPADLTDITYWWNTGYGIVESGGALSTWTDQINGKVLTSYAGTAMTYTAADANVNNQPSVYQNGTYATIYNSSITPVVIGGTDDYSIIFIGKPETVGSAAYAIWGGNTSTGAAASELAPYISSPDGADVPGYYRFGYTGNGRTNTATTAGTSVVFHAVSYKNSTQTLTQYYNTTTANTTTTSAGSPIDRDPFLFEIGGYSNSIRFKGRILEAIVLKSVPTTQELTDLNTYVQNKYV